MENLDFLDDIDMEPTIQEILDNDSLRWIFVGGKGGVGKTTNSSCLAIQLSKVRESVLIISTDPAHNLSDAFSQQFSKEPTLVKGFENLYAMEVEPKIEKEDLGGMLGQLSSIVDPSTIQDLASSFPGIDEAMSFGEVLRLVQTMKFSAVVFDTAPTGHTLRLLSFPALLGKALNKLSGFKNQFSGIFNQFSGIFGLPEGATEEQMMGRLDKTKEAVQEVSVQFKNPDLTTFVCVCIPEFLSLYETERLLQELATQEFDSNTIIINQIVFPEVGKNCSLCNARRKMQQKYIDSIHELYADYHLLEMPLMKHEIRGLDNLLEFSELLVKPYNHEENNNNDDEEDNNNNN
eukprot:TRINITY_DN539_c0_g2_i1.p1 TRINITY_DN539_c0_g2~~TRINITY_DN539_c0_g2_i1.p1  ORF type:complete len:348 (+),score=145.99 TRINITY_DN539_c0_g2_i1:49-1092(+)